MSYHGFIQGESSPWKVVVLGKATMKKHREPCHFQLIKSM